jgi:thiosulfate/3-mercaptopyruvate sulfurtransferase
MTTTRIDWSTLVSPGQLAQQLDDPRLRLFDCRHELAQPGAGREVYERSHLPGAVHVHLDADLSGPKTATSGRHPLPDPEVFAERLRGWGVDDDSLLLAYDDANGTWASRFWWMAAKWLRHRHVAVLDGGFRRWVALGLPVTTVVPAPLPRGDFTARLDRSATVDVAGAADAARDAARRVIDARAPERYRGEVEPIDRVAGHIPGAINHPNARVVAADGTFLSAPALRASFEATLKGAAPADAVTYCGSGVAACHLLLALEHAGLPGAKLYPGSWSEWTNDPSRPVATGSD